MEYNALNNVLQDALSQCSSIGFVSLKPCPPRCEPGDQVGCYIGNSSVWSNVGQTPTRNRLLTLQIEKNITLLANKENNNSLYEAAEEVTAAFYGICDDDRVRKLQIEKILFLEDEVEQKTNGENIFCHFEVSIEVNKKIG